MSKSKVKKDTIKSKSKISDLKKKKNKSKTNSPLLVLKTELKEEKEKYLRLFAEFENYKKRTSRERIELFKTANKEVMSALIPILDDYDRANSQINDKNKTRKFKPNLKI